MDAQEALLSLIDRFAGGRIFCAGDVMLDHFIYGTAARISPEAPIPVLTIERQKDMLGGAGNVVRNIVALGGRATLLSVIGEDAAGARIAELTDQEPRATAHYLRDPARRSTEKSRFVAGGQQLLRADAESRAPLSQADEARAIAILRAELPKAGAAILSDYGKGLLGDAVIKAAIEAANAAGVPLIVDPKRRDFSAYRGAWMLTPNVQEFNQAAGQALTSTESIAAAARELMARHGLGQMLITRGAAGMLLVPAQGAPFEIAAKAREVFDVSGAGDTVAATLALAIAAGASPEQAAKLANLAAGLAVGKLGTSTVGPDELRGAAAEGSFFASERKIVSPEAAAGRVRAWQSEGKRVGFTNGCFDLIHAGHLALIHDARNMCDRLVLAINSDASVKALKGPSRPVNDAQDRARLLAELPAVDCIVVFDEETPLKLLEQLKPDILMKGADYAIDAIVGADFVTGYGGEVRRIPLREGFSSTRIIEKVRSSV